MSTEKMVLQERVDPAATVRRVELQRHGMGSNCSVTPGPNVVCNPAANPGNTGGCTLVSTPAGPR